MAHGYAGLIEGDHLGWPAKVIADIECFLLD
jgi:hypothetical protein